jgi:protein-S-isoprenylcysteine O-methyltransferase Ste14
MNILEPWNIVFFVCFAVYFWIRHVFVQRTKNEKKAASRFDRSEKLLLAAMFPPVILLPLLYLFTPLLAFADYRLPGPVLWLGAATMVASLWLFWRSHADLGQNWSVSLEIREGHQLVTQGVYRSIRHPMYASIWLWGIAQGMLLQNWLAGWSVVPVFAVMYFLRLPREEQMMCDTFGEQYRAYMRRTGRIIPRIMMGSASHAQKDG